MAVFKINKTENYTVMSNYHLRDLHLSLRAKGLLSIMLSLPPDWDYSIRGLVAIAKDKKPTVEAALLELKKNGYLLIEKKMPNETASGRIEYVYNIFETPQEGEKQEGEKQEAEKQGVEKQGVEKQGVEKQGLVFQGLEKQTQLNTYKLNKEYIYINSEIAQKIRCFAKSTDAENAQEIEHLLFCWIQGRKEMNITASEKSIDLNLEVIPVFAKESGMTVREYLSEVIRRGWRSFFVIQPNRKCQGSSSAKTGTKEKPSYNISESEEKARMGAPQYEKRRRKPDNQSKK